MNREIHSPITSHDSHLESTAGVDLLTISSRLELRWALSFSHGASDRDVAELAAVDGAAEEQSAAAHVAAPDEIGGETETLPKMLEQNIDVFRRSDAAEKNDLGGVRQFFREQLDVALQRGAITRIVFVNIDFGEFAQIGQADGLRGRDEPARRRDDQD